jgi:CHAD domain-containing protein
MRDIPTAASGQRNAAEQAVALDCSAAFQKIALDAVEAIESHRTGACAGDAEAVHQIRVAITRLRAAVAFFAPIVAGAEWLRLKQEIRWLNGPLGAARDSDVIIEYARSKTYRAWAQAMIGARLEQDQARDHRALVRCLRSARTQRLIAALARWARQGTWLKRYQRRKDAEPLPSYCAGELNRRHAHLVRKGKRLKDMGAARRHRLRIRVKRFRYVIEALTETVPLWERGKFHHLHRPAKRLQRALGDMRDLERLADLAGGLPPPANGKRGRKYPPGYRQRNEKLLDAAIAAHRDLKRAEAG